MGLPIALKKLLKPLIRPLIYRFPPVYLTPGGLYLWFDALSSTKDMEGEILEVGCYLGATAALSARYLEEIGSDHRYTVLDTFAGFVDDHVVSEIAVGGTDRHRHDFSGNTPELARWVMDRHGGGSVKMIVGDVTTLPDRALPERIVACLLDIDLAEPIYVALCRIYPRMVPGGVIIVDDCDDYTAYKARLGYERFVAEWGLAREITLGKGIVRVPHGFPAEPADAAMTGRCRPAAPGFATPAGRRASGDPAGSSDREQVRA